MKARVAIGIDIGGTNTKLALVTNDGMLRGARSFKTQDYPDFPHYLAELTKQINELIEFKKTSSLADTPIAGIGVGAPNANWNNGCIVSPVNLKWGKVDIAHQLEAATGLPVELDNDANTAAIGEALFGVAKGVRDFVLVTLGTGVGTGIFAEGIIIRSENGKAGEGGHIVVQKDGRLCGCGGKGHLEIYASSTGVEMTAQEIFGKKVTAKEISELYKKGDALAEKVVDQTAEWLGLGLSTMAAVLNPSLFVIAGGVSQISEDFDKRVQHWLDQYAFKAIRHEARVKTTSTNQETGSVLGAAALILHSKS
ncbi:MAG: ROK family protein [Bacteriovoracaceae bacterium]|nr:ROK family protein [Bacteriovoracaceae bacterium]